MRRPAALYSTSHLPDLPGRLRAVLALWVEGTLLGLNGCQDAVTLALAQCSRGPRNPHTLRRRQRELLYDDADRIDSWGPGQEVEPLVPATVPVRSLIPGPGGLWVGTGQAFRDAPLASTLIVLHDYGQAQPWVLRTNTPVAQTEPTLYACRNWIEQGVPGPEDCRLEVAQDPPLGPHPGGPPLAGAGDCHLAGRGLRYAPRGRGGPPPGARAPAPAPRRVDCGPAGGAAPASPQPVAAGRGAAAALAAARLSLGLRVAATYARPRLPRAPAPGGPRRHLNLPASLSPHPGRLGPPHPAARQTGNSAPLEHSRTHTAADSCPRRAWPRHARAKPTDPAADSHPGNTLANIPLGVPRETRKMRYLVVTVSQP